MIGEILGNCELCKLRVSPQEMDYDGIDMVHTWCKPLLQMFKKFDNDRQKAIDSIKKEETSYEL